MNNFASSENLQTFLAATLVAVILTAAWHLTGEWLVPNIYELAGESISRFGLCCSTAFGLFSLVTFTLRALFANK